MALHKHFGKVRAVDGLDLSVPRGSVFALVGSNGAGKTTFIKLLLALCRPTSGQVRVFGGDPAAIGTRRRVGYLPENLQLPPALSALDFLDSVGRLKGLSRAERRSEGPRLLREVGLDEAFWRRRTGKFSKGMRQRTGLAAALLGAPELLVLDEPTDGIDPLGRARVRALLRATADRGATVFLNSHMLAESEKLCDHVAIMDRGRVVLSGAVGDLRAEDAFRVRLAGPVDVQAIALRHGLEIDDEARKSGLADAFCLRRADPIRLSATLRAVLAEGALVLEVAPRLQDLEQVLAGAVAASGSARDPEPHLDPASDREARP